MNADRFEVFDALPFWPILGIAGDDGELFVAFQRDFDLLIQGAGHAVHLIKCVCKVGHADFGPIDSGRQRLIG